MGLTGMTGRHKRRFWSDEEKRMIVAQCAVPGVSVSQVARRYDVNANLVFTWRRDTRYAAPPEERDAAAFLPVTVAQDVPVIEQEPEMAPEAAASSGPAGVIRISLAGGHRVEISGSFDGESVALLLKGLLS